MSGSELEILTLAEAAKLLRLDRSTLYRMVHNNQIPVFRIGRVWRFRRDVLEAWMDQQQIANGRKGNK